MKEAQETYGYESATCGGCKRRPGFGIMKRGAEGWRVW